MNSINGSFHLKIFSSPEILWFNAMIDKYYKAVHIGFAVYIDSSDPNFLENSSIDCFVELWQLRDKIYPEVNISPILTKLIFEL